MFESVDVEVLDISTFDTSKVTDMRGMFAWNNKLTTIIVGDKWDTSKVTESNYMFSNNPNIVGEDGTTVGGVIDLTNAHTGAGGYLTKNRIERARVLSNMNEFEHRTK